MTKQSSQSQNCFSFPVADGLCERCAHHGVVPHRRCRQWRSVSFFHPHFITIPLSLLQTRTTHRCRQERALNPLCAGRLCGALRPHDRGQLPQAGHCGPGRGHARHPRHRRTGGVLGPPRTVHAHGRRFSPCLLTHHCFHAKPLFRKNTHPSQVYSVVSPQTFAAVSKLHHQAVQLARAPPAFVLVANKADLEQERAVAAQEGRELAAELACPFFEVSARLNRNVTEAFMALVRALHTQRASAAAAAKKARRTCTLL